MYECTVSSACSWFLHLKIHLLTKTYSQSKKPQEWLFHGHVQTGPARWHTSHVLQVPPAEVTSWCCIFLFQLLHCNQVFALQSVSSVHLQFSVASECEPKVLSSVPKHKKAVRKMGVREALFRQELQGSMLMSQQYLLDSLSGCISTRKTRLYDNE